MPRAAINITLGGVSYGMRPAWEVPRDVEARLNMTTAEILECAKFERISLMEAATIVFYGCNAGGAGFTDIETVAKRIFEIRLSNLELRKSICQFLLELHYVPEEAVKKFEAEVLPLLESQANT